MNRAKGTLNMSKLRIFRAALFILPTKCYYVDIIFFISNFHATNITRTVCIFAELKFYV